jgi:hypothetical protein
LVGKFAEKKRHAMHAGSSLRVSNSFLLDGRRSSITYAGLSFSILYDAQVYRPRFDETLQLG